MCALFKQLGCKFCQTWVSPAAILVILAAMVNLIIDRHVILAAPAATAPGEGSIGNFKDRLTAQQWAALHFNNPVFQRQLQQHLLQQKMLTTKAVDLTTTSIALTTSTTPTINAETSSTSSAPLPTTTATTTSTTQPTTTTTTTTTTKTITTASIAGVTAVVKVQSKLHTGKLTQAPAVNKPVTTPTLLLKSAAITSPATTKNALSLNDVSATLTSAPTVAATTTKPHINLLKAANMVVLADTLSPLKRTTISVATGNSVTKAPGKTTKSNPTKAAPAIPNFAQNKTHVSTEQNHLQDHQLMNIHDNTHNMELLHNANHHNNALPLLKLNNKFNNKHFYEMPPLPRRYRNHFDEHRDRGPKPQHFNRDGPPHRYPQNNKPRHRYPQDRGPYRRPRNYPDSFKRHFNEDRHGRPKNWRNDRAKKHGLQPASLKSDVTTNEESTSENEQTSPPNSQLTTKAVAKVKQANELPENWKPSDAQFELLLNHLNEYLRCNFHEKLDCEDYLDNISKTLPLLAKLIGINKKKAATTVDNYSNNVKDETVAVPEAKPKTKFKKIQIPEKNDYEPKMEDMIDGPPPNWKPQPVPIDQFKADLNKNQVTSSIPPSPQNYLFSHWRQSNGGWPMLPDHINRARHLGVNFEHALEANKARANQNIWNQRLDYAMAEQPTQPSTEVGSSIPTRNELVNLDKINRQWSESNKQTADTNILAPNSSDNKAPDEKQPNTIVRKSEPDVSKQKIFWTSGTNVNDQPTSNQQGVFPNIVDTVTSAPTTSSDGDNNNNEIKAATPVDLSNHKASTWKLRQYPAQPPFVHMSLHFPIHPNWDQAKPMPINRAPESFSPFPPTRRYAYPKHPRYNPHYNYNDKPHSWYRPIDEPNHYD